jgi:hypothetical protein
MSSFYDDIDIEDMRFDLEKQVMPCISNSHSPSYLAFSMFFTFTCLVCANILALPADFHVPLPMR